MKARTRAKAGAKPAPKPGAASATKGGARSSGRPCADTQKRTKSGAAKERGKQRPGKAGSARRPSDQEAEEHFVRGVLVRGEAAKTRRGKLPSGATHEIVEETAGEELPKIRRRRFSLV